MRRALVLWLCPACGVAVGLLFFPSQFELLLLCLCAGIVLSGVILGWMERKPH